MPPEKIYKWEYYRKVENFPLAVHIIRNEKTNTVFHSHDFAELLLVTGGTGRYITSDGEYQLEPGDIFLLAPGQSHAFANQHHLQIYNVLFLPEALTLTLNFHDLTQSPGYHLFFHLEPNARGSNQFKNHLRLNSDQLRHASELIENINREMTFQDDGYQLASCSLLGELLVMICRLCMTPKDEHHCELQKIARAVNYMNSNFSRPLDRAKLAKMVNMSEASFFRHFKRSMGKSPMEYLQELRLNEAEKLLRNSVIPLTDIAEKCGFYDSNHFGMVFRRHYRITPHRFRALFRLKKEGKSSILIQ